MKATNNKNIQTEFLLDTGAQISALSTEKLNDIKENMDYSDLNKEDYTILDPEDKVTKVDKVIRATICIDGCNKKVSTDIVVLKNLAQDAIPGINTLEKIGVQIILSPAGRDVIWNDQKEVRQQEPNSQEFVINNINVRTIIPTKPYEIQPDKTKWVKDTRRLKENNKFNIMELQLYNPVLQVKD